MEELTSMQHTTIRKALRAAINDMLHQKSLAYQAATDHCNHTTQDNYVVEMLEFNAAVENARMYHDEAVAFYDAYIALEPDETNSIPSPEDDSPYEIRLFEHPFTQYRGGRL